MNDWDTMSALLGGVPDLSGARCRGRHELFDSTIAGQQSRPADEFTPSSRNELDNACNAALRLCAMCPALDPCRAWLDRQRPTRRPRGVIAGQLITASGLQAKTQPPADRHEDSR